VLAGGIVAGLALMLVAAANAASSSSSANKGSAPPKPGPGAKVERVPAGLASSLPPLKRTTWPVAADASGQQAGTMILIQPIESPSDWVLFFQNKQTGATGLLSYNHTPTAGLIAQMFAAGM
jgi:hypothetical protein